MAPSFASKFKLGRPAPLKVQSPTGKSGKEPLASLDDNAGTGRRPYCTFPGCKYCRGPV